MEGLPLGGDDGDPVALRSWRLSTAWGGCEAEPT
jgi:hypothetical protein